MIEINKNPSQRELRQFAGIWFPLFCAMIGLLVFRRSHAAGIAVWSIGAVVALIGLAAPMLIKPLFVGMMYASFPIGWVMTHVLLGILYYGVISPVGAVMRLAGRDTMTRKFDRAAATYWIPREPAADKERYFRQY
jgi:multisubunit Na+/H+ antiporter MnhG subunit